MSKNNLKNDIFKNEERLKLFPYVIAFYTFGYWINMGLWALGTTAILIFIIALVVLKIGSIVFRFINFDKWKSRRYSFLLTFTFILIIAFLFDFQTIRDLWLYRFGTETQGHVIKFIKTTKTDSIIYEFSVEGVPFQNQQEVSNSFYENLDLGSPVNIKYTPSNPNFSYLDDIQHFKGQTGFTLIIGLCIIFAMFANEIHEKIILFLNSSFRAKKSA